MRTPALLLRCLLPALLPALAAATLVDAVRRDTGWIAGVPSRCVGSEGHASVQTQLLAAARAVPGAVVLVQEFPVVVPSTRRAVLALAEGPLAGEHAVHPVWPDLARLKTTPEAGISGRLVYVGAGGFDALPARTLRGQIAVMEMRDARNWRKPFAMGAAAVLFLGGPEDQAAPPAAQALHKPRYYVPEGPLADALRAGALASARIDCDAAWQTVTARNILVAIPASAGVADAEARERAAAMLERVGLEGRFGHLPRQLSGGQQQRVACARALANAPKILLADEPTGNLDLKTGEAIIALLSELKRELGVTVVSATHDHKMLAASDRVVYLEDGRIVDIKSRDQLAFTEATLQGGGS